MVLRIIVAVNSDIDQIKNRIQSLQKETIFLF